MYAETFTLAFIALVSTCYGEPAAEACPVAWYTGWCPGYGGWNDHWNNGGECSQCDVSRFTFNDDVALLMARAQAAGKTGKSSGRQGVCKSSQQ